MEKRKEALEIRKLGPQERLDEEERKKDRPRPSIKLTEEEDRQVCPPMDALISRHREKRRHTEHKGPRETTKLVCMEEPMLGDDEKEEQKSKEAFYGGSNWVSLDHPVPPIKGKEVYIEHTEEEDQKFYPRSNSVSSDFLVEHTEEEQKGKVAFDLIDTENLEAGLQQELEADMMMDLEAGEEQGFKEAFEEQKRKEAFDLIDTENPDAGFQQELEEAMMMDLEAGEEQEFKEAFEEQKRKEACPIGKIRVKEPKKMKDRPRGQLHIYGLGNIHRRGLLPVWMSGAKILYLCFGEYMDDDRVRYSIQALQLHYIPSFQALVAKEVACIIGKRLPLRMGCGLFRSNIVFLGGLESVFDGHDRFPIYPREDVYAFDTEPPHTCHVINNSSLRAGKSHPLLVQYDDKLFVLSTFFCLRLSGARHFSPAFEMFDPKQGKWSTLPDPEIFAPHGGSPFISHVVVGSHIFISASFRPILCFDMANPSSQQWREHNFTNCPVFPVEFFGETLTVEYGDGNWVIFSCQLELHVVGGYHDDPRHYEWKSMSIPAYLMSKDYTLLRRFKPDLKFPHGFLPPGDKPLHVCDVEYKLVHLRGREICVIISVDSGDESEDGEMERMQTYLMVFEFEIVKGKHTLAFKILLPLFKIIEDRPSESRTTKLGLEGAFFL